MPLVGAQVLADGAGARRIVLYGFVATAYGKTDAARKALAFVENESLPGDPRQTGRSGAEQTSSRAGVSSEVENRIEIRPEIARMKNQVAPSGAETGQKSFDQVLKEIDHYGVGIAPAGPNPR